MMNKISIEKNKFLLDNNNPYYLNIKDNFKMEIIVKENINTRLVIVGNNNYDINFTLLNNSNLIVNSLNNNNSVNINIVLNDNSKVIYNHSVKSNIDSINTFSITHKENNSTSIINNNGINLLNNKLFFIIDGVIPKKLKKISCIQNSKIINYDNGNSKIVPNLIIDSNDIIANHSAYIGNIDYDMLFYLKSRGLSEEKIEQLIYKATLLGKMELIEEKEEFNNLINEWW